VNTNDNHQASHRKPWHPAPGTKQVSMYLPVDRIETVRAIWETRCRTENPKPTLSSVYTDLMVRGIECTDLATGKGKPQTPDVLGTLRRSPNLPYFGEEVDVNQFVDDTELFALMDASWMMLWAAAPNNENIHANSRLVKYTGRSVDQILGAGWTNLIHPDDRTRVFQTVFSGFLSRRAFRFVYRMERIDGIYGCIADLAQPRYRPDGRFAGYIGTMYEVATEYDPSKVPESIFASSVGTSENGH
jgi:PAS domain-containing protein